MQSRGLVGLETGDQFMTRPRVLLTDHPWPDTSIESAIFDAAGLELVAAAPNADTEQLLALADGAVGIVTCWAQVPRALLALPTIRVVSRLGVGLDNIDVSAAAELGIVVTYVPDYCVEEVSDHAVALSLAWARGLSFFEADVRAGRWRPGAVTPRRVRDLSIGVWGLGRIGTMTARKFAALGCSVIVDRRHPERTGGFRSLAPLDLAASVDVLSLHMPLNQHTRNIVDANILEAMRPAALLVNVSRGALVDVNALVDALDAGRPGAAALDVLPNEPEIPPRLRGRSDVVITPHVAFASDASVATLRTRACEDHVSALRGAPPPHVILPSAPLR